MLIDIFRWMGDETLLQNLLRGFPSWLLLVITAGCIFVLSKGAGSAFDDDEIDLSKLSSLPICWFMWRHSTFSMSERFTNSRQWRHPARTFPSGHIRVDANSK
jgi:hypothetical protein